MSNDIPLGFPFNVACYATILQLFSDILGYEPGVLTYVGGDVHIYENQIPMIEEQMQREPRQLPTLQISGPNAYKYWSLVDDKWKFDFDSFINQFEPENFKIMNYDSYPTIKIPLSVGL